MNNEDKMNKEIWTKEDILRDYDDAGISGRSKQDYLETVFEKAEKYDEFVKIRQSFNALDYITFAEARSILIKKQVNLQSFLYYTKFYEDSEEAFTRFNNSLHVYKELTKYEFDLLKEVFYNE